MGGKPLALATIYRIFANPFYAGIIRWDGGLYPGNHEPIITHDEFETVRRRVERPGTAKPQRHKFAYTGMIRCGA
jgi:hypothetical protein